jgi:hypothetical protein
MPVVYPIPHDPSFGKGSVLLDIFDLVTGLPTGLQHLGNVPKFEIEIKDDKAELFQFINATPSKYASAVKKREVKLTVNGNDFNSNIMAIAQASSGKTTLAVAAGAVVAEVLISAAQAATAKGRFFRTLSLNVDNVTTPPALVQNAVPLVLGVDYTVADAQKGLFYFPTTGTVIVAAFPVTITYTKLVGTFDQVPGANVPFVKGRVLFVPDPTDGQKIGCEIWRVNLSPSGQLGLIADDYGNWTLDGDVLDDSANHPGDPFYQYTFF